MMHYSENTYDAATATCKYLHTYIHKHITYMMYSILYTGRTVVRCKRSRTSPKKDSASEAILDMPYEDEYTTYRCIIRP